MDKKEYMKQKKLRELIWKNPYYKLVYYRDDYCYEEPPEKFVMDDSYLDRYTWSDDSIWLYSKHFQELKETCVWRHIVHEYKPKLTKEEMEAFTIKCNDEYIWTNCIVLEQKNEL